MATAPALMTMEQYLKTSFHPDVDFVDGEIEERNVGEFDHSTVQALLVSWFRERRKELRLMPLPEWRIRVSGSRVRICDLAVIRAGQTREQVAVTPPLICIEILSPEDRLSRAQKVLADYRAMGVENIWLIDPLRRSAHIYNDAGLHVASNALEATGTGVRLDLEELFTALDESDQ